MYEEGYAGRMAFQKGFSVNENDQKQWEAALYKAIADAEYELEQQLAENRWLRQALEMSNEKELRTANATLREMLIDQSAQIESLEEQVEEMEYEMQRIYRLEERLRKMGFDPDEDLSESDYEDIRQRLGRIEIPDIEKPRVMRCQECGKPAIDRRKNYEGEPICEACKAVKA